MAKRVSIINFKGGVGKTTLAFHLGTGLVRYFQGTRVLLIDIDHQSSLSIVCEGAANWQTRVTAGTTVDTIFKHLTIPGTPLPGRDLVDDQLGFLGNLYPKLHLVPSSLQLDNTEIQLTSTQFGDPIASEWSKRTLLCQWLEDTGLDAEYDYIIIDCPPATKIVSQNAIALSHGFIVPVVPEAVMARGAPHLVELIQTGIDPMLRRLSQMGSPRAMFVPHTALVGLAVTRIQTSSRAFSGYTNDHTQHLNELQRRWDRNLLRPYIEGGTGIGESMTLGLPVFDRQDTQNVGGRGFGRAYQELVTELKTRIDAL